MKNFNECFLEYAKLARGQLISKCLQFPTKNELKQVKLRFHCSKVEFVRSFFVVNRGPPKTISELTFMTCSCKMK